VRYSLQFPPDLDVPRHVRVRAGKVLRDVAASLQRMPASTAWDDGLAELNLGDWRFEYRVDPARGCIQVLTAHLLAAQPV
jgi:hypothetical protein